MIDGTENFVRNIYGQLGICVKTKRTIKMGSFFMEYQRQINLYNAINSERGMEKERELKEEKRKQRKWQQQRGELQAEMWRGRREICWIYSNSYRLNYPSFSLIISDAATSDPSFFFTFFKFNLGVFSSFKFYPMMIKLKPVFISYIIMERTEVPHRISREQWIYFNYTMDPHT